MFCVYVKTSKNSYFLIYGILIYSADRVKIRYVVKTKTAWISISLKLIDGFELYNDLNLLTIGGNRCSCRKFWTIELNSYLERD